MPEVFWERAMVKLFEFMIDDKTALLLIDVQKGLDEWDFFGEERNNPHAEENMASILIQWRKENRPVFHVQHSSINLKSPLHASKAGFQIKDEVTPLKNERVITKEVNSAFIGTGLKNILKEKAIEKLVVVGLTTNHCVSTSARMAANLGFEVILISDATACFNGIGMDGTPYSAELMHQVSLASLKGEFAKIISTEELIERLAKKGRSE
ncbi:MAG: cysteine hydrolase family protein [Bacteroidota bacterium]